MLYVVVVEAPILQTKPLLCYITRSSTMAEMTHSHAICSEEGLATKGVEDDITNDLQSTFMKNKKHKRK